MLCWWTCRCIDALRQLETPESWSQPAVALLALQAFLAAGNAQQAEVEAAGDGGCGNLIMAAWWRVCGAP